MRFSAGLYFPGGAAVMPLDEQAELQVQAGRALAGIQHSSLGPLSRLDSGICASRPFGVSGAYLRADSQAKCAKGDKHMPKKYRRAQQRRWAHIAISQHRHSQLTQGSNKRQGTYRSRNKTATAGRCCRCLANQSACTRRRG